MYEHIYSYTRGSDIRPYGLLCLDQGRYTWVGLQCVIVAFTGHTRFLLKLYTYNITAGGATWTHSNCTGEENIVTVVELEDVENCPVTFNTRNTSFNGVKVTAH